MTARRLPAPLLPAAVRGPSVAFFHDGRRMVGHAGEPLAAALLVAGRPVISRSFRLHRPRGLLCDSGQCGWCECTVDGVPSVRSCRVLLRAGMVVRSEHSWPSAGRDLLGLLGAFDGWLPAGFYRRRLPPRLLRDAHLQLIRRLGGRGRAPELRRMPLNRPRQVPETIETDVLVVGAGPAGLLAALAAAQAGAEVVVVEAEPDPGGGWRWRNAPLPDGRPLRELIGAVNAAAHIRLRCATTALGWYPDGVAVVGPEGMLRIAARALIAASGGHEQLPDVANNDRPGVMGARTVEWLINGHGVLPGQRAVVLADDPDSTHAGELVVQAGGSLAATIEPSALGPILGRDRVRGVGWRRASGASVRSSADLLIVGRRAANLDLAIGAGVDLEWTPAGLLPRLDAAGASSRPGLWVVGTAAGRRIAYSAAMQVAEATGASAGKTARASAGPLTFADARPGRAGDPATTPWPLGEAPPPARPGSVVCFCEDVRADDLRSDPGSESAAPELLKRRTEILTGACQGKYCLAGFVAAAGAGQPADEIAAWRLPTGRPPLRPVRLDDLVGPDPPP